MEPFMLHTKFNNPSDMEVGPDGRLYVLEYGSGWFAKNDDAGLARIDYNGGNRPPEISSLHIDKTSGDLPLQITATVDAKDPDNDAVSYTWHIGNKIQKETKEPKLQYTISKAGDYLVSVQVTDDKKASSTSNAVDVYAGNAAPTVDINIAGNKTFYFPGNPVRYKVDISDKDDTSKVDLNNLVVTANYTEESENATVGDQALTQQLAGKNLMLSLDCKGCHKVDIKSVGPAFVQVSQRYQNNPKATATLAQKIINGGSGNWGTVPMAAHPNLKESDAKQIVSWILSLANQNAKIKSLPQSGSVDATMHKPVKANGILKLYAAYTDNPGPNIRPLMGSNSIELRNSNMTFETVTKMDGFSKATFGGRTYLVIPQNTGWFKIDSIDLTDISRASLNIGWQKPPVSGYTFEVHLDSPQGEKIGEFSFAGVKENGSAGTKPQFASLNSSITRVSDGRMHDVYIVSKQKDQSVSGTAALASLQFFLK